jgi:predicted ArsR family transcriptional regulator
MQRWSFKATMEPAERIQQRIRMLLESRSVIRFAELCERLCLDAGDVRPQLEAMRERGEVRRLRPVGWEGDELDVILAATVPWRGQAMGAVRC